MSEVILLLVKGFVIGLAISAPVGTIGILCIRRTLTGHYSLGFVTGLGATFADVFFASISAFGLASVAAFMQEYEFWLKLGGAILLVIMGIAVFRTPSRPEGQAPDLDVSYAHAFSSAFFLTCTNPITILAFAAVFAAMGVDHLEDSYLRPLVLVGGVAAGACCWWLSLSTGVALMRDRLSPRQVQRVSQASGVLLLVFAFFVSLSLLTDVM